MIKKIIMFDSPKAASYQTVSGWVSSDGRFFGDNERMARYCGSTHRDCDASEDHSAYRTNGYCESCRQIKELERFNTMPVTRWDGKTPLYLLDSDMYFFDQDAIADHCDEYGLDICNLKFILCEPVALREVESDYWEDSLPEDADLPSEIQKALDALNAAVREHGQAVSWMPSSKRVVLSSLAEVVRGE